MGPFWRGGESNYGETNVPVGLSNVVAVSSGQDFSLALKNDGKVVAWGATMNGETSVPPGLSNVVAIDGGVYSSFVLRGDGTVTSFGSPAFISIPAGLTNVVAITAGDGNNAFALKRDGTVVGLTVFSTALPPLVTNVVAISAGEFCNLAIVNDGSPYIEQHPSSRTAFTGSSVSFNVVAVGIEPLSYQWMFNGTFIPGATGAKLSLSNVALNNAGGYQCKVTNLFGAATSATATLTLRSTPQITGVDYDPANGLTLHLDGLSGYGSVIVYASSNLSDWVPIFTNPPITGTFDYVDPATQLPARFYRVGEQ